MQCLETGWKEAAIKPLDRCLHAVLERDGVFGVRFANAEHLPAEGIIRAFVMWLQALKSLWGMEQELF